MKAFAQKCVIALLILHAAHSLEAATLTVTSLADSGPGTLRDLAASSAPGDTIEFAVGGILGLLPAINISHTLSVHGPDASLRQR
jgi:hypothetical protein